MAVEEDFYEISGYFIKYMGLFRLNPFVFAVMWLFGVEFNTRYLSCEPASPISHVRG